MKKYKVRAHQWVDGFLSVFDEFFENLDDAVEYAQRHPGHSKKVYDGAGLLAHHFQNFNAPDNTTYA
jgi:truncated hemoglobin YjbI